MFYFFDETFTERLFFLFMAKKGALLRVVLLQKILHVILRETLLKKGSPSNSLPKTLDHFFSEGLKAPLRKNKLKSLERGLGKNLSSERFPPIITYKMLSAEFR